MHLAWSSDLTTRVDRVTDAVTLIGAGELLRPGEVRLAPGDEYRAPRAAFVHSTAGLDGFAHRVHTWLRARPQHPSSPRPLVLNTWEAVYFDHDPVRLAALADRAAEVGIERFVLDDGWFQGRRDDSTSLGDWTVDRSVWPDGLGPLADRVHGHGMQFGLWFEPEMISLDSDVARAHPDWLLHDPGHLDHDEQISWRGQYVMDLANPDAYAHVFGQIDALVTELGIDFIKWDHNRDLVESVHAGRPGGHAQMMAVYALLAELKAAHPALEIESCSSGGARTDLGILDVTDRVWASDSNDPVERQDIQRWTGLLLPPELVGAHVGPTTSHSSGRTTALSYRMATSLMGSAGFEWDILSCDEAETAAITRFAALYKELRPVVHGGRVLHPELRDPAWRATAFVGADGGRRRRRDGGQPRGRPRRAAAAAGPRPRPPLPRARAARDRRGRVRVDRARVVHRRRDRAAGLAPRRGRPAAADALARAGLRPPPRGAVTPLVWLGLAPLPTVRVSQLGASLAV